MSFFPKNYTKRIDIFWFFYKINRTIPLLAVVTASLLALTVLATVNADCLAPQAEDNTPCGTNVTVQFADKGINVTFANVTKSGYTSVDISGTGPGLTGEYDLLGQYCNVTTTANYTGKVTVCIIYSDAGVQDESNLQLLHYETDEKETIVSVRTGIDVGDVYFNLTSWQNPGILYYNFGEGEGCEVLNLTIDGPNREINGTGDNFLY